MPHSQIAYTVRNFRKQAEAEVVPSSSLVEVEVEVEVEVGVEVEVWVEVEVGCEVEVERKYVPPVGWGGWLEIWRVKLNSTQVVVDVRVELGKSTILIGKISHLIRVFYFWWILDSSSHMLRHMVQEHHMMDMKDVRWAMFILDFKRSAFERQISEAVAIQQVAQKNQS